MPTQSVTSADVHVTDLVVVGSGVAGLTAALAASIRGLRTVVLEHSHHIGGTSARSSGTVWIPDNHYLREHGELRDRALATEYLTSLVAEHGPDTMWKAFLDNGPEMLADLERHAGVRFRPYMSAPDYRQDHPGAAAGGRALEPLPFDGRELGDHLRRVAWPLPELMLFGAMMVTRGEAMQLLRAHRSPAAMWLGARMLGRYLRDRLAHQRGTRLVLGNALIGRLLKALLDRKVEVWTDARCSRLLAGDGRVHGVELQRDGHQMTVHGERGVVLAGGGFPASKSWRDEHLPAPVAQYTAAAQGCDGSTLALALDVGAALGPAGVDNALWFPSSIATRADGSTAVYPHIVLDRSKPGLIAVDQGGRRFVNEAVSYHEFVRGMYRAHRSVPCIPAWLICDRAFIRHYGLGLIRPRTPRLRKYVDSGYLHEAASIGELATAIGVLAPTLEASVERFNGFSRDGIDRDFGKGENIYDLSNGDPQHQPNPCVGPIDNAPFYALAVLPTPLGTSRGLIADEHARASTADGEAIAGLYVCGNDMQSAFGGQYPGAGGQLGQAMTFAWVAARHACDHTPNKFTAPGATAQAPQPSPTTET